MSNLPSVKVYFNDPDLKRRFSVVCASIDKKMSEVIYEFIEEWTGQKEIELGIKKPQASLKESDVSVILANVLWAHIFAKYKGVSESSVEQFAIDNDLNIKKIQAALNNEPVSIDFAGDVSAILGYSLEDVLKMIPKDKITKCEKTKSSNLVL